MKRKQKSASRRHGELLPIDSYSLMGDPSRSRLNRMAASSPRTVRTQSHRLQVAMNQVSPSLFAPSIHLMIVVPRCSK